MNYCLRTLRIAGLLVAATSTFAAMAQPATPASSAASAAAPITAQPVSNPTLQIQVPKQIEVKLLGLPEPSGGPGWMGSLVIGAILAALSSIATTLIGADKRHALETDLQRSRHSHELEVARLNRQHADDLKVRDQEFQEALKRIDLQHQSTTQRASLSREDQKIETERRRLKQQTDASDLEIEVAVARMAREHEAEVAKLIHLFFDRLTSENATHRDLALQALSEFVDVDVVRKTIAPKQSSPGTA